VPVGSTPGCGNRLDQQDAAVAAALTHAGLLKAVSPEAGKSKSVS